jgi:hypothetical protein
VSLVKTRREWVAGFSLEPATLQSKSKRGQRRPLEDIGLLLLLLCDGADSRKNAKPADRN